MISLLGNAVPFPFFHLCRVTNQKPDWAPPKFRSLSRGDEVGARKCFFPSLRPQFGLRIMVDRGGGGEGGRAAPPQNPPLSFHRVWGPKGKRVQWPYYEREKYYSSNFNKNYTQLWVEHQAFFCESFAISKRHRQCLSDVITSTDTVVSFL